MSAKASGVKDTTPKRAYYLPDFETSVEASSVEEAIELAKKQQSGKDGDG